MPKDAQMGVRFLTVSKINFQHFVLLLLYVCVYHSGNNMSSKSGATGEILLFENPLKMDMLTVSAFNVFIHTHDESKHYLSHWFAHSAYKIDYRWVLFLELEAPKCLSIKHYVCWNVSWPASADNLVKNGLSLPSKLYPNHCGMSLHQAPMFYFTAKCLGSF